MTTQTDWAWLGGIIDADGCITVQRFSSRSKGIRLPAGRMLLRPYVLVVNSDKRMVDEVQRILGGRGCVYLAQQHDNPNWNDIWRYQAGSNTAREIIREVRPYLRVKDHVADLVLQLPELKRAGIRTFNETIAIYDEMDRIGAQVQAMNRRGRAA